MKVTTKKVVRSVQIAIVAIVLAMVWKEFNRDHSKDATPQHRDYSEIATSGKLRVVTEYNAISYILDRDTIVGFNYELIQAFARDKALSVEITPEMSFERRLEGLSNGTYDLIAYDIPTTNELKDSLLLTVPIILTKQVLVQRNEETDSTGFVHSQLDLANRTLHVAKGSPAIMRIRHIESEIAEEINVEEIEKYSSEQLMAMVAHGDINYAVIEETIAKAYIDSFPQLDINTGISMTLFYSWGVSKQSPALRDTLDAWLTDFMTSKEFRKMYNKYYASK